MADAMSWQRVSEKLAEFGYDAAARHSEVFRAESRLFSKAQDASESIAPRLVFWRDMYGWCPFCMPVQLVLEEKQVPYRVRKVPLDSYRVGEKDPEFLRLVPEGIVPATSICVADSDNGFRTVSGIDACLQLIEASFPAHRPMDHRLPGVDHCILRGWASLIDGLVAPMQRWLAALSEATPGDFDSSEGARSAHGQNMEEPTLDPELPQRRIELQGVFDDLECTMAEELRETGGPYLLGAAFSLVDAMLLPWAERLFAYASFFDSPSAWAASPPHDRFPHLIAWLATVRTRPSYHGLRLDEETLCRAAQCFVRAKGRVLRSWHPRASSKELGLQRFAVGRRATAAPAMLEAAAALAECHEGILALAAQVVPGSDAALAPKVKEVVDQLLRCLAAELLQAAGIGDFGSAAYQHWRKSVDNTAVSQEEVHMLSKCSASALVFIRNRISVPRDMRPEAALALRRQLQVMAEMLVGFEEVVSMLKEHDQAYCFRFRFPAKGG